MSVKVCYCVRQLFTLDFTICTIVFVVRHSVSVTMISMQCNFSASYFRMGSLESRFKFLFHSQTIFLGTFYVKAVDSRPVEGLASSCLRPGGSLAHSYDSYYVEGGSAPENRRHFSNMLTSDVRPCPEHWVEFEERGFRSTLNVNLQWVWNWIKVSCFFEKRLEFQYYGFSKTPIKLNYKLEDVSRFS